MMAPDWSLYIEKLETLSREDLEALVLALASEVERLKTEVLIYKVQGK